MNFEPNEDQRMIRDMARDFAKENIGEQASMSWDQEHQFPQEILSKMGELGLMGMNFPEEYGGAGVDTVAYVLAMMEISRGCSSIGVTMGVNHLVCEVLNLYGTEAQKSKFLTPLTSGKGIGAFCLTEPQAGSDAQNQKTRAVLEGEHYLLNGKKAFITNGGFAKTFIVTAVTGQSDSGAKEISAFIIEKGSQGLILGAPEHKMGQCASNTVEVTLENLKIPKENLLGGVNGFKAMLTGLNSGRIGVAAQCCGISQAALDAACEYAKQRETFGKPLSKHQAIQFKIAEMATLLETSRLLTLRAAQIKDAGKNFVEAACMAKFHASESCNKIVNEAVQIHGGYGYIREYLVEKLYRDARVTTLYEGSSEIQKMVIARSVLK
jgi:alkylation response protein AidB-like acyl-CoA dehydrogenase